MTRKFNYFSISQF